MTFETFNFHPAVAAGIRAAGFTHPTPIQCQAIGPVMQGNDIMGVAQTGTGKTAAFALPLLHRLAAGRSRGTQALIIAPTRELAEQITREINMLGAHTPVRAAAVYGGVGLAPQTIQLKQGAAVVVACPGRLIDHINRGHTDFKALRMLVLDEADQMLDMGFLPDIRRILAHLPQRRQTLLFSATMPPEIRRLADDILDRPQAVQVGHNKPAGTVSHAHYPVAQQRKTPLLLELLSGTRFHSVLVFTRTKHRAKRLGEKLAQAGYRSASLQGNLSQARRQAALDGFKSGKYEILVATDIAARGIDVSQVSHVINYDIPDTPEAYIHRIGRTGRAARSGEAFSLITGEDTAMVRTIDRLLGGPVERRTLAGFDYGAADTAAPVTGARPRRENAPVLQPRRPWRRRASRR